MTLAFTLWVDADAAPRDVKEVCFRASERLQLETVLVANQRLTLPLGYRFLSAVRVEGGPDVADQYIAIRCKSAGSARAIWTFQSGGSDDRVWRAKPALVRYGWIR